MPSTKELAASLVLIRARTMQAGRACPIAAKVVERLEQVPGVVSQERSIIFSLAVNKWISEVLGASHV